MDFSGAVSLCVAIYYYYNSRITKIKKKSTARVSLCVTVDCLLLLNNEIIISHSTNPSDMSECGGMPLPSRIHLNPKPYDRTPKPSNPQP